MAIAVPETSTHPALLQHGEERARSAQNRIADAITRFAGSMWFAYLHIAWFSVWIGLGVERYPYGLLTMIVSLEAIFLSTYTRDTWMHRMDTARAVDAKAVLTPGDDGRIVADVVADWARRQGKPFELVLAGPAGRSYRSGTNGERLNLEAVEFCSLLSRRGGGGQGLPATFTPF